MFGLSSAAYTAAIASIARQAVADGIKAVSIVLTSATRGRVVGNDASVHSFDVA